MTVSRTLVVGDTLSFAAAAPTAADGTRYTASAGWSLTYRLIPRVGSNSVVEIVATADGDDFLVQASAAATASWGAGDYGVAAYVTKGAETYTVAPVFVQALIVANPRTLTAGTDTRTQARKALDDARQALADAQARAASGGTTGSAIGGVVEYEIAGRRMKYASVQEAVAGLIAAVSFWRVEAWREQRAEAIVSGLADPGVRVVRPIRG